MDGRWGKLLWAPALGTGGSGHIYKPPQPLESTEKIQELLWAPLHCRFFRSPLKNVTLHLLWPPCSVSAGLWHRSETGAWLSYGPSLSSYNEPSSDPWYQCSANSCHPRIIGHLSSRSETTLILVSLANLLVAVSTPIQVLIRPDPA